MYQADIGISILRIWKSYGYMGHGVAPAGISSLACDNDIGTIYWYFATSCNSYILFNE